ncbi:pyruvate carboxylase [Myxococcus landrumensis]|uniref:Pyruvate carboxylase n=1 Tax=Myxococcus landrumensis TaxID=2813577 RepID=A0ABX7NB10_9BACT|nr:pyruvate carboxylase [Myxococcus landrumus]QSQ15681.1 pyruvate carboxylase [Myxococcus landrumus]
MAQTSLRPIQKVLCANRGEIAIRVFRACNELGIRTVAIYSDEDRTHEHRHKADEAYRVGHGKRPVEAYLGIEEILDVAVRAGVDAIHPGYGFLSENALFAEACERRGIRFIGPSSAVVRTMGDKVAAKQLAKQVGVPTVPGTTLEGDDTRVLAQAREFFAEHGGPVLVKAAHGGGGRGMRVVREEKDLEAALASARSEAQSAFGSSAVFLEKFLEKVRHIEVQLLGDLHGNLVHLHERDCSVQRRHQKVIEIAPAPNLSAALKHAICDAAVRLAREAGYSSAGTAEFLVSDDHFYFIECNARLQVEHTVTEQVTGVDLVQSQIRIAEGYALSSPEVGIPSQDALQPRGYAVQLRVTTEDPSNNFMPDAGIITAWRAATGFGIRLDGSNGYTNAHISPYYDSMLVKVIAYAPTFQGAVMKGQRALREFRIRGVKTNLPFLENVLRHPAFQKGETYTRFIDETPELFHLAPRRDRASKLLTYLAEVIVNGHPTIKKHQRLKPNQFLEPRLPVAPPGAPPRGTAQILAEKGPRGLAEWVLAQKRVLLTDTTMRDAHQSLLATRMRTRDVLRVAPATAHLASDLFSLESWGGATFDTAYRFLNEDPWARLRALKAAAPNLLLQMLLRGANAVGYTSYPNNVVEAFIDEAAEAGVDVFRIFDSLNDLGSMEVSINRVLKTGKVAEVAICYTGDVANPKRKKYTLDYYADLAKRIEDSGAHFLCIKDMAGLLRPRAAATLMDRLREVTRLPIHLHMHDTAGNGIASYLEAIEHGVHIVDVALGSMAGLTSQPSLNALVSALRGHPRETGLANARLQPLANYWEDVREYYAPFESGLKSTTSEVYYHEIPGGQYSNLRPQVAEMGLLNRWNDVKDAFALVNVLVGDIPKVTPSSKMVGDFAIFLLKNDLMVRAATLAEAATLTHAKLIAEAPRLDFPSSVVGYFRGELGQPPNGFPEDLRTAVLKGLPRVEGRPSASLPPLDLEALRAELTKKTGQPISRVDAISSALYPRVMAGYLDDAARFEDVSILDTPNYFYGMEVGQEIWVDLEPGKTLVISLSAVGEPDEDGLRTVYFALNGHNRTVQVRDRSRAARVEARRQADRSNPNHVAASMPGTVIALHVKSGAAVEAGAPLVTLEAMKMETVVRAPRAGTIAEVATTLKASVQGGDLLAVLQ